LHTSEFRPRRTPFLGQSLEDCPLAGRKRRSMLFFRLLLFLKHFEENKSTPFTLIGIFEYKNR
jgi:hypothetical protein